MLAREYDTAKTGLLQKTLGDLCRTPTLELFKAAITLVTERADPNIKHEPISILIVAARNGKLDAVKTIIAHGGNINITHGNGFTSLHMTVMHTDNVEQLTYLLKNGADPTIKALGKAAREFAEETRYSKPEMAKLLKAAETTWVSKTTLAKSQGPEKS